MRGFMRLEFIGMALAVALLLTFVVSMYSIARKINYSISYEKMVKETICEIVKPEYIKDGYCNE